ncbi:MAG TPA: type II CAAX endopeptidase family protein [Casimicrobiaceae bacterium]|nr:type II CAAX endopeptidase family protein [Casimicrobiaceae bacterium]
MTRRPAFWIAYAALAALALGVAWHLFPLAIPLVNLDVTMSRREALARAEELAQARKLAPDGARSAVRFSHDGDAQNYIELEGGGKAAFAELVKGDLYAPYWWDVRVFKPGDVSEVVVRFKPDGKSNGFGRRVPETYVRDEAVKALAPDAARSLAEAGARGEWGFDLAPYKLLEQSQQTRPNGRVDHLFVYERPEKLGEARIRLRLGVTGDELTEVAPYVHIPESFERRFRELRSANDAIAGFASVTAGLLYGLGGCVLGALWLARKHWLVVKPALGAGFVVGGLLAAAMLVAAPAAWFGFDTAQSTTTFWLRQIGAGVAVALGGGLGYALVFMTAESLTRRAFPAHPQLWRVWAGGAAPTPAILGRTLGGYLFVPVELALVAAFYYATNRWLGWWQPSEVLTDPDILSNALPALMPVAVSLQAGFMEECLFRAVPLALGALIGARFGRRKAGIAVAFVLQAVVFGAAHANYPGFPSYSRLVELVVPAMIWAAIFLRFGLLPTIVLHALFDLTLFSIPLYLVDAPLAWVQRGAVIVAALVPLGIVLWRRARAGAWRELPPSLRNGAWVAPSPAVRRDAPLPRVVASRGVAWLQRALPAIGLAGLGAWIAFTPMKSDVPALAIDRQRAESAADAALASRGVALGAEWRRMSTVRLATDEPQWPQHAFVWREAGPGRYRALVGSVLAPPLWDVRYAMFEGDVSSRAEEWRITVDPAGNARQVRHALPEASPGARLEGDAARAIAERAIASGFGVDPAEMKLVSSEQKDRPARTDWAFTYADPGIDVGKDGEARFAVTIAGDEIAATGRYVYVPEAWSREEREREGRIGNARIAAALAFAVAAIAALGVAVRAWMRRQCDTRAAALTLTITLAAAAAGIAVMWPTFAIKLKTTEPVATQVLLLVAGLMLAAALGSLVVALATGVGTWAAKSRPRTALAGRLPAWAGGSAAALAVAGAAAVAERFVPPEAPLWPSLPFAAARWPWAAAALHGVGVVSSIGVGLFVLHLLDRVTASWTRRAWLAVVAVVALVAGIAAARGSTELESVIAGGLVAGAIAAAIVYAVLRFDARTIPGYVVAATIVSAGEDAALDGTAAGWAEFAVYAAVAVAIGWAALRYIERSGTSRDAAPPT